MERYSKDGVEWLEFDLLADIPGFKHAVFLRHGGASVGPYEGFNTSYDVGDNPKSVESNLNQLKILLQEGIEIPIQLHWAKQCHGKEIVLVETQTPQETIGVDALVTSTPGLGLIVKHADCQGTIFFDPQKKVFGVVHAGWRGNVLNIYEEMIRYMQNHFGSKPADLLVCISPSLGPDDAEFIHYLHELPEEFWPFQVRPTYFDFWGISEYQLQRAGVLPHHIEVAKISTFSNQLDYYSYRRHKITGRHGTVAVMF